MYYVVSNELYHHGILGQKWGVRRYQNPDGSLTAAGKKRYLREVNRKLGDEVYDKATQVKEDYNTMSDQEFKNKYSGSPERYKKRVDKYGDPYMNSPMAKFAKRRGWR